MLPSPFDYDNWQDYAAALCAALGNSDEAVVAGSAGTVAAAPLPDPPAGVQPVFWDPTGTKLILSDSFWNLPQAPDLVTIDTLNLADASVTTNQIAAGAVGTNALADLAVVTAKIANATIVSALIGDLQVVSAKIADAAINNAKIANLAVGSAQVQDAAIGNAKIANLSVATGQIIDLQVTTGKIALLAVTTATIADAAITTAKIGTAQITSALIGTAQIVAAAIAALAVGTGSIQDAAITTAKIADAQITTAKIGDAQITSAKVASLLVDKIASGQLNATIDVSGGIFKFLAGSSVLFIGNGFGSSGQFFLWFGPVITDPASATESNATMYLRRDGSAYFGGTLAAGVLRTTGQTSDQSLTASVTIGPFSSNGGEISVLTSFSWERTYNCDHGTGNISGSGSATVAIQANTGSGWTTLGTLTAGETMRLVNVDSEGQPPAQDQVGYSIGGSTTLLWTPGALTTLQLRAVLTSRTEPSFGGSNITLNTTTQNITLSSTE